MSRTSLQIYTSFLADGNKTNLPRGCFSTLDESEISSSQEKLEQWLYDCVILQKLQNQQTQLHPHPTASAGCPCHLFSCASVSNVPPRGDQSGEELHWPLFFICRLGFYLNSLPCVIFYLAGWKEEVGSVGQRSRSPFQQMPKPVMAQKVSITIL